MGPAAPALRRNRRNHRRCTGHLGGLAVAAVSRLGVAVGPGRIGGRHGVVRKRFGGVLGRKKRRFWRCWWQKFIFRWLFCFGKLEWCAFGGKVCWEYMLTDKSAYILPMVTLYINACTGLDIRFMKQNLLSVALWDSNFMASHAPPPLCPPLPDAPGLRRLKINKPLIGQVELHTPLRIFSLFNLSSLCPEFVCRNDLFD